MITDEVNWKVERVIKEIFKALLRYIMNFCDGQHLLLSNENAPKVLKHRRKIAKKTKKIYMVKTAKSLYEFQWQLEIFRVSAGHKENT